MNSSSRHPGRTTCTSAHAPPWPTRRWKPKCGRFWRPAKPSACRTTSQNGEAPPERLRRFPREGDATPGPAKPGPRAPWLGAHQFLAPGRGPRYLPEYKATRAQAGSFMGLATNVDYATEVTLQPLERFPLDAAILFSDILTVPDAMGLGLSFAEGEGPRFAKVVRDEAAVAELAVPDMDKLRYVFDAVTSIRKALNGRVPLIGFSGIPWTLACYMVEGKGSDDYRLVKSLMYSRSDLMHRILAI